MRRVTYFLASATFIASVFIALFGIYIAFKTPLLGDGLAALLIVPVVGVAVAFIAIAGGLLLICDVHRHLLPETKD